MTVVTQPTEQTALRRTELGTFLRSRRERISPEQAGLVSTGRRRTPGLRREEVALLAGVSTTWYTWLEQGRDVSASAQVVAALSRALRLSAVERQHFSVLANQSTGEDADTEYSIDPGTRTILDALEPYPAFVVNARGNILAYNRVYNMISGVDEVRCSERNCLWLMFTSPVWRERQGDQWEMQSAHMVASYRARMAGKANDPLWIELVKRLRGASDEFDRLWRRHDIADAYDLITKTFVLDTVGSVSFTVHQSFLHAPDGLRLCTYLPADEKSRQGMETLYSLAVERDRTTL